MTPHLPGNTTRRTRETQQKSGENPVRQRLLALGEQRLGEVVEGAPIAVASVVFAAWAVVIIAPWTDVAAVTPETWEWAICPLPFTSPGPAALWISVTSPG